MDINTLRTVVTLVSLAVFIGIIAWAWRGRFDEAARLPFEGDEP
ncbi:MAG: CcoQ/FixQ family Cbb3-type cytochrome c oxidase assembly chaperone [Proteobacteria bacterium]|nr:CcoQ/FixQ family Cbb3-type cytochrome c oxidase assembly chaperone [Methylibium sp.]MBY0365070.1 cbb3-type cytochrome c oxidase subunit 3 [Burkholderiaceae bacterium]MCH8855487.1 CcoQ/FixQ family Cbb3-type cytochrome c oxidase assembly chaperone [Pseudomonadota bacterium]RTL16636.1 MAG: CcoQ/FixQ family Cbb3-type cytochrome c oxidase assembly chaperone [Burkholderiales bacterium]